MVTVTKLHPLFMAEIGGVDLTMPVSAADFAEIETAFHEHAVLLFRGPPVSEARQVAFSQHFGPLIPTTNYHRAGEKNRLRAELADVSNIDHEGRLLAADNNRRLHSQANQLWHTDASFKHVPARCSLLSAHEVPPSGGETEFADMRAAYGTLTEDRKREIEGLIAEHSIYRSREQMGLPATMKPRAPSCRRFNRFSRGPIRAPGAKRCISLRMPRTSSAGRSRRAVA
jgi:alpha-ketoglutarate-dependent 2,4-dichlorophenoxyacetate dioxygenase